MRYLTPLLLRFLTLLCVSSCALWAEVRVWTSADGSATFEGELLERDGDKLSFRMANGRKAELTMDRLSEVDQEFINSDVSWMYQALVQEDKENYRELWPETVEVDKKKHKVQELPRDAEGYWVYRSEHFEFHADVELTKELVKHFSLTFEATRLMVRALPLGLEQPQPENGYFQVYIFQDYRDYIRAGAIPNSGGTYKRTTEQILVPLSSLSVERTSTGWRLNRERGDPRQLKTLIHELVHQLTHDWMDNLPIWFTEGIAEYVCEIPYNFGRFSPKKQLPKKVLHQSMGFGNVPIPMHKMELLLRMSHIEWNSHFTTEDADTGKNYRSAYMLVYFFMHLHDESGHVAPLRLWIDHMMEVGLPPLESLDIDISIEAEGSDEESEAMAKMLRYELLKEASNTQMEGIDYTLLMNGKSYMELDHQIKDAYDKEHMDVRLY